MEDVLIIDEEEIGEANMEKRSSSCSEPSSENASNLPPAKRNKPSIDVDGSSPGSSLSSPISNNEMKNSFGARQGYGSSPTEDGSKPKETTIDSSALALTSPRHPLESVKFLLVTEDNRRLIDRITKLEQIVNGKLEQIAKLRSQSLPDIPPTTACPPNCFHRLLKPPPPPNPTLNGVPIIDCETNTEMNNDDFVYTRIYNSGTKPLVVHPLSYFIVKMPKRKLQEVST